jgi:hypothetical protein
LSDIVATKLQLYGFRTSAAFFLSASLIYPHGLQTLRLQLVVDRFPRLDRVKKCILSWTAKYIHNYDLRAKPTNVLLCPCELQSQLLLSGSAIHQTTSAGHLQDALSPSHLQIVYLRYLTKNLCGESHIKDPNIVSFCFYALPSSPSISAHVCHLLGLSFLPNASLSSTRWSPLHSSPTLVICLAVYRASGLWPWLARLFLRHISLRECVFSFASVNSPPSLCNTLQSGDVIMLGHSKEWPRSFLTFFFCLFFSSCGGLNI